MSSWRIVMQPWFKKYAPQSMKEVVDQDTRQLASHAVQNPRKKALMIHGPAGVGKTCSISALAQENGWELVEFNASDARNKDEVKSIIGNASVTGSLFGKRIILIDDVDSLNRGDRGGVTELINCIKDTRTPIFLTAIDPWDTKLRSLRGYCSLVEFKKPRSSSIKDLLRRICDSEGVKAEDSVLYRIAVQANGDIRAAINNLEMLSGDGEVTEHELDAMGYREKPISIFNALQTLFKTSVFTEAVHSLDDVGLDFTERLSWISENITKEFRSMSELKNAFNALSRADVFYGRIRKMQYWRYLVYANLLMTSGVNVSRESDSGFVKYSRPTKVLNLWKSKPRRELRKQLALKLKPAINASLKKTIEILPFIKLLSRNQEFVDNYELTSDELKAL